MLADGLDPYEIPGFGEPEEEESSWQPDYWGDEDPDDPANWQSGPNEPSDSDEDLSDDSSDSDEDLSDDSSDSDEDLSDDSSDSDEDLSDDSSDFDAE
ncbi:hypothetical protein RCL_jg11204.t1 [Rhizophagus clarus]|uniref:Uncharacterized protein n=1 Tax=Rhizophagus clarus TaxID=94130 RepID=A0A8H3R2K6_9GLOM|nr:hypothetical protein RCL_jg11204.t1 [Rhizophagus clarus]